MFNKLIKLPLFMSFMVLSLSSCDKIEDSNPTNGRTTAIFNPEVTYGTMTDQDGNIYKTLTLGTQVWMAENLRTTKYNDGMEIPNVTDDEEWIGLTTGTYCNYNNTDDIDTIATYGRLYNWYAVNTGKLAPQGWHVPTDDEWSTLTDYLRGTSAGCKLKETGTSHWYDPNTGATNETGFTALPGGQRTSHQGTFSLIGMYGRWWSSSEISADISYYRELLYRGGFISRYDSPKNFAISVRCVKD